MKAVSMKCEMWATRSLYEALRVVFGSVPPLDIWGNLAALTKWADGFRDGVAGLSAPDFAVELLDSGDTQATVVTPSKGRVITVVWPSPERMENGDELIVSVDFGQKGSEYAAESVCREIGNLGGYDGYIVVTLDDGRETTPVEFLRELSVAQAQQEAGV